MLIIWENYGAELLQCCKNFLSSINTDMKWENGKAPRWKIMHKVKTWKIHLKKNSLDIRHERGASQHNSYREFVTQWKDTAGDLV
jgi:hypothetical protein